MTQSNETIQEVELAYGDYEPGKVYVTKNLCWSNYVARDVYLVYLGPTQATKQTIKLASSYDFLAFLPDGPKNVIIYQFSTASHIKTHCFNERGHLLFGLNVIERIEWIDD